MWNPWDAKYDGKAGCFCAQLAVVNSSFQVGFDILILLIPFAIFRTLKLNKSVISKYSVILESMIKAVYIHDVRPVCFVCRAN